jgi:hypothetical protein
MSLGEDFWAYLATLKKIGRIVLQSSGHPEPNAIKIQGSVITGSCKYRKNLQGPVVFKFNAIKHIFPVFTGIFL